VKVTLDNPESVAAPFGDRFAHVARLELGGGALLVLSGQWPWTTPARWWRRGT
jgi:2-iminobutanoate/2-iminopropanoate deaminase